MAYLFELSQDLTDQALDQFDRLLGELLRKGERRQEKHLRINSHKMNSHLTILTKAAEAFLQARTAGNDPVQALLDKVPEAQLQATIDSAKQGWSEGCCHQPQSNRDEEKKQGEPNGLDGTSRSRLSIAILHDEHNPPLKNWLCGEVSLAHMKIGTGHLLASLCYFAVGDSNLHSTPIRICGITLVSCHKYVTFR